MRLWFLRPKCGQDLDVSTKWVRRLASHLRWSTYSFGSQKLRIKVIIVVGGGLTAFKGNGLEDFLMVVLRQLRLKIIASLASLCNP